ncbi:MAG: 4-hydroxythreonine-4-phosphate dehydrogenase PdxA [Bacteroidetes bacterium]|nr:4-hydroxythreonine-4-phosphate dehydrogenase PdxA [Bacteroidota bacterium]MBL6944521.1 4-hydroxythreonine-4-phosphate dehydrogenase PdxA [Bacteroidales bacterium]
MERKLNQQKERKILLGITHGDFNGINYEIIIKSLADNRMLDFFTPVIYGLSRVMSYNRKNLNLHDFNYNTIRDSGSIRINKVNLINLNEDEIRIEYGKSNTYAGNFAHMALDRAVKDLKSGKIVAVVTAPINKENIKSDEFDFPGHTEYFAHQFETKDYLMLMVSNNLKIGIITGHIPLLDVPITLTEELILSKIKVLENSLKVDFGIEKPKIAVLGLNPHAGENGNIGKEDRDIINPAIITAKKKGTLVFGPFAADGFFAREYIKYDAVLAMYHDQGLIPFKTLAFDSGVNYTAGLPFVRTSPAHGTAYDKAGKNVASPESIRNAMYLAVDIHRNRLNYEEMNKNPLGFNLLKDLKNCDDNKEIVFSEE